MTRIIPATMATQHPDNAFAPYWSTSGKAFVGAHKEMREAVICFDELGTSEYMWDWEGKHADAAVIDKLFTDYYKYFSKTQLARDKFLTFRIPNVWEEKGYSLLQAMTVILTSEDFARDLQLDTRPLFEIILPMTESADQLMKMHELFEKLARFKSTEFNAGIVNTDHIELIPLVESIESQQGIGTLLDEYIALYQKRYKKRPAYIRPFLARSDPALVSGMIATVIANKLGLSRAYEFSERSGIEVYPISGVGSLPFRGGISPETVDDYIMEYPGMRTVSIQSSFRYDHPKRRVQTAIQKLEEELPKTKPHIIGQADQIILATIAKRASSVYQETLQDVVADMRPFFAAVPKRRERRQHIGLLAYGRSMGEQKLPRAITFTAGFYSIGVPPEFIGTGRMLQQLSVAELKLVRQEYRLLQKDLERAGRYLNRDNLRALAKKNPAWKQVEDDIAAAEQILGVKFGPKARSEKAHKNLTSNVLLLKGSAQLQNAITETAQLRRSLG